MNQQIADSRRLKNDYVPAANLSLFFLAFAYLGPIPTSHAEVFGFITGALAVWFVAKNNLITWPIGIVNAAFFVYLFWEHRLYADMSTNIWYMFAGAYGWWQWTHGGVDGGERPVAEVGKREAIWVGVVFIALVFGVKELLIYFNGAAPWLDSITASLSMAAFYLQARRYIEAWWLWILADIIYIPLYFSRDLYMTGILYIVFMIMCFIGLSVWRRELREQANA